MGTLIKPTTRLVNKYIAEFNLDERYLPADQAITKLFNAFPKNKDIEEILLKISVINDLYSTNILGTFKMAQHILQLDIDHSLNVGNPYIVNQIAIGHGIVSTRNSKEINFYSFATKYCNWHNREQYAIYDSFVERVLLAYKKKDSFSKFKQSDLREFPKFKQIIYDFINFYHLNGHDLKEIDKFLWMYGKKMFPKKYY